MVVERLGLQLVLKQPLANRLLVFILHFKPLRTQELTQIHPNRARERTQNNLSGLCSLEKRSGRVLSGCWTSWTSVETKTTTHKPRTCICFALQASQNPKARPEAPESGPECSKHTLWVAGDLSLKNAWIRKQQTIFSKVLVFEWAWGDDGFRMSFKKLRNRQYWSRALQKIKNYQNRFDNDTW